MKMILFVISMMVFGQVQATATLNMTGTVHAISKKEIVLETKKVRYTIDRGVLYNQNKGLDSQKGKKVSLMVPMHAIKKSEWLKVAKK